MRHASHAQTSQHAFARVPNCHAPNVFAATKSVSPPQHSTRPRVPLGPAIQQPNVSPQHYGNYLSMRPQQPQLNVRQHMSPVVDIKTSQSVLIECKNYKQLTPKKSPTQILRSIQSPGLPVSSFSGKARPATTIRHNLVTLGEQPPTISSQSSHDMRSYLHCLVNPFSQSISSGPVQSLRDEPRLPPILEEDQRIKLTIDEAVFNMFKKKSSIEMFPSSPQPRADSSNKKNHQYFVRPTNNMPSTDEEQSGSIALHSFNPQQYQQLVKATSETAVQTSFVEALEANDPLPELNVPLPYETVRSPKQEQESQRNIKLSVIVHRDSEQIVMEGSTTHKTQLIQELQDLFQQYTKQSSFLSMATSPSSIRPPYQQYIKMSNLEESLFFTQKQAQEECAISVNSSTKYKVNADEIRDMLKQINGQQQQPQPQPYPGSQRPQQQTSNIRKTSKAATTSKSPFLKTYSAKKPVPKAKAKTHRAITQRPTPQRPTPPRPTPQRPTVMNFNNDYSIFDERTFKF